jgi:hypothetical protein
MASAWISPASIRGQRLNRRHAFIPPNNQAGRAMFFAWVNSSALVANGGSIIPTTLKRRW